MTPAPRHPYMPLLAYILDDSLDRNSIYGDVAANWSLDETSGAWEQGAILELIHTELDREAAAVPRAMPGDVFRAPVGRTWRVTNRWYSTAGMWGWAVTLQDTACPERDTEREDYITEYWERVK